MRLATVALEKPDGGLRVIAVGELIYRLVTKAVLQYSFRSDFLLPYKFGVGEEGGSSRSLEQPRGLWMVGKDVHRRL